MSFASMYLKETIDLVEHLDVKQVEAMVELLLKVRKEGGRLFFLGSGGGAGHASHATCDFRKLGCFEAYCPSDNVSELTARINDEGWGTSLSNYLNVSKLCDKDALFIFSVGGGDEKKGISQNLVEAIKTAKEVGAKVLGVVGKNGGYTKEMGDAVLVIPPHHASRITPHTEGLQAVLWHLLISHPTLQMHATKWESVV